MTGVWRTMGLVAIMFGMVPRAWAQDLSVAIIDHGIYRAETVRTERLANGFNSNIVKNICHVATTEAIPARMGVQFGFRYRLDGAPTGGVVTLTRVTRFPQPVKPSGGSVAQSLSDRDVPMRIGTESYIGYGFDHAWELVSGRWAIELWYEKKMLAQQLFQIGDGEMPDGKPQSGENCFELSVSLPGIIRTGGTP